MKTWSYRNLPITVLAACALNPRGPVHAHVHDHG